MDWEFEGSQGWIAGVDEVGRGCLSGPVVAAAFVASPACAALPVRDSKQLSPERRARLYDQLIRVSADYAIGIASAAEVDATNVLAATLLAMRRAVRALRLQPFLVLVDGNRAIPDLGIAQRTIVRGDATVGAIAAASIIAKVTRDTVMERLHHRWPPYRFSANKGYGTEEHLQALRLHGPCPVHRMTFSGVGQMPLAYRTDPRECE